MLPLTTDGDRKDGVGDALLQTPNICAKTNTSVINGDVSTRLCVQKKRLHAFYWEQAHRSPSFLLERFDCSREETSSLNPPEV